MPPNRYSHLRRLLACSQLNLRFLVCFSLFGLSVFVLVLRPGPASAQTYTDLYDFNCATDGCQGAYPGIPAQARDGDVYGTLPSGGASGEGVIYKITPTGTFSDLYFFGGGAAGSAPESGLSLGTDGDLYGATLYGGNGNGLLFKISTTGGPPTILYTFGASEPGGAYGAPVQGKMNTFYGVTSYSRAYSITSSGTFTWLPHATPGASYAPLILATDGNFYGTTGNGGLGYGTVFRMSSTGAIKIIYNFDSTHGATPVGPVVQGKDGNLYGTTSYGGSAGGGVVFKLSMAGAVTVLHDFDASSTTDGFQPNGGLVAGTDGNFYGITTLGNAGSAPYGTLFKITKTGAYALLHAFDSTHGAAPKSTPMQHTNGFVYGETYGGGNNGSGVFYSWNAAIPTFVSLVGFPANTAGQAVEILGQGLTGTTSVKFGTGSASFNFVSDTYITAVVPADGTTGNITVTTPGGILTSAQTFKVIPVLSSFIPASGPVGTTVTITGSGFIGTTRVTFGSVKATHYNVNSAGTQITATVPTGAVTGNIAVTTPGGTAYKGTFTVT